MGMARSNACGVFRFGEFEADIRSGELLKHGTRVPLQEQPFQVLAVLLERPGELVRREELRQQVWPQDTFVEFDHALNTAVKKIRIALGDCADSPDYVETIPKRGYRFIAAVEVVDALRGCPAEDGLLTGSAGNPPRGNLKIAGVVALAIMLLASMTLLGMHLRVNSGETAGRRIVLAVLPLQDWSDEDAQHSSLCDGITQEVITQSGRAEPQRLAVVPHASALHYRHTDKTVAQVAHELHADYLLAGSLRGDRRHLRVTVELIRVSDESRVWGDEFNRETGDTLALETDLAAAITSNLTASLFPHESGQH
jgi:DNA-binding winged helix-turn-helix (wHTH) protein/TolB-like protein